MHFSVSITNGFLTSPVIASTGQLRAHRLHPLHFSGSICNTFGLPLQSGQNLSRTWALVVLAEVAQRGLHGLAGALTQTAERGVGDRVGELLEKLDILFASLVADDALESFQHALRTLAAGDALAARIPSA